MAPQYYSQRQLSPYRGMLHVVDVGHALAYTVDGDHWRTRLRSREGMLWPVGTWLDANLEFRPEASAALRAAMENRPLLPFPQADRFELWLLGKASAKPLALLQSRRSMAGLEPAADCAWRPFLLEQADFRANCLRERDAPRHSRAWPVPHRDVVERQVNNAARPYASAQWFVRGQDGTGEGLGGTRVGAEMVGRVLPKGDFPELLVDENWSDGIDGELVREYHNWNAAMLLTHLDLCNATRRRLEIAACLRPEKLLEIYRLIPAFINRAVLEVALVQARLMLATQSAAGT